VPKFASLALSLVHLFTSLLVRSFTCSPKSRQSKAHSPRAKGRPQARKQAAFGRSFGDNLAARKARKQSKHCMQCSAECPCQATRHTGSPELMCRRSSRAHGGHSLGEERALFLLRQHAPTTTSPDEQAPTDSLRRPTSRQTDATPPRGAPARNTSQGLPLASLHCPSVCAPRSLRPHKVRL